MRKALRRKAQQGQAVTSGSSLPAPVEGWDASSPISAMSPKRALVLDNWFPTASDVRVRRGSKTHAGGMGTRVVDSLLPYHGVTSATSKMFAATNSTIYDATTSGPAASAVTGLSNNRWQHSNFTTSGGKFLWICNGADAPRHYNGSAWATPALTVTTFSADNIINVHGHKNRLWVVFKDSTVAGYLGTGAVAGSVTNFELGGLFTKGGYLVAIATWTRDGGDGADDLWVGISSEGQVAIYSGTDPSDATKWALIGVFNIGRPIGYRCFTKVAGDLALVCIDGVLPLSKALGTDRGAARDIAITARIKNAMNAAARDYKANFGWELCPYPLGTQVLLNVPVQEGVTQHQYTMNTETGAWCRYTGMNANCWCVFRDDLYFGGNDGLVYKADVGSVDVSEPVLAIGQQAYTFLKAPGLVKEGKLLQAIITTDSNARPALGISTDFRDNAVLGTPSSAQDVSALFDSAVFDDATFAIEDRTVADWASISGEGYSFSVHFRAQTGSAGAALWDEAEWDLDQWGSSSDDDVTMRLNAFQIIYEEGQVI